MNRVVVCIETELGCNTEEGEYDLYLTELVDGCMLNISEFHARVGIDDISLIVDAVVNHTDFSILPDEGYTYITLEVGGEWEDVFWHKYYNIVDIRMEGVWKTCCGETLQNRKKSALTI